jgi:hypothetical protein
LWALAGEGGQVGGEHGVEQAGVLYAGGADDLAKLEAAEAGGDDVLRSELSEAILVPDARSRACDKSELGHE